MDDIETVDETQVSGGGPIFPLSRVKKIMKADRDVHMCSADAVTLTAMATENFLEMFTEAMFRKAAEDKKKTLSYKEAANAVKSDPRLEFLAPLIPQTIPLAKAIELKKSVTSKISQDMENAAEEEPEVIS